jgi:hypothetical protein
MNISLERPMQRWENNFKTIMGETGCAEVTGWGQMTKGNFFTN